MERTSFRRSPKPCLPTVRAVVNSRVVRMTFRYVAKPLAVTAIAWLLLPGRTPLPVRAGVVAAVGHTDCSYDVVQDSGQKIEFGERREMTLRRPDRARIDVTRRDGSRRGVLFDGQQLTAFDLEQMTRLVVGARWSKMSAAEREQVVELFRRFSVSTYASEFTGYGGEQFEVGGDRDQAGLGTMVETRIVLKKDKPVALNYLLRQTPRGWKIIDVYLSGTISELATRRSEFSTVLQRGGADALVQLIEQRSAALRAG